MRSELRKYSSEPVCHTPALYCYLLHVTQLLGDLLNPSYHIDGQCHTDMFLAYFANCVNKLPAVGFLMFAEFQ